MPKTGKKRAAASQRERYKRQRTSYRDGRQKGQDSDEGSEFFPDSSESEGSKWEEGPSNGAAASKKGSPPPLQRKGDDIWESANADEGGESEESDGLELLLLSDEDDEDDLGVGNTPASLYPLFSARLRIDWATAGPKRAVYKGDSATTHWRKTVSQNKLNEEAKKCDDIRTFFAVVPKTKRNRHGRRPLTTQPVVADEARLGPATETNTEHEDIDVRSESAERGGIVADLDGDSSGEGSSTRRAQSPTFEVQFERGWTPPDVEWISEMENEQVLVIRSIDYLAENLSVLKLNVPGIESQPATPVRPPNSDTGRHSPTSQHDDDDNLMATRRSSSPGLPADRPKRPETRFEIMERTLQSLLRAERRKGSKADMTNVVDIAVLSDFNVLSNMLRIKGHRSPEKEASLQIARMKLSEMDPHTGNPQTKGPWFARQLRKRALHVAATGSLPDRRQGKGAKHASLLDDKHVARAVKDFFVSTEKGKISPKGLAKHLNTEILPTLSVAKKSISESTAKRWMLKHGYRLREHKKGVYMDGHERKDVVADRQGYLGKLAGYDDCIQKYEDTPESNPIPLILPEGKRRIVPVFHDESCFHANDQQRSAWLRDDEYVLRQKSRSRLVHASDFVVEDTGRLCLTLEQIAAQLELPESERLRQFDARKIIYPGKNADKWWDMEQLIEQVNDAIPIFEKTHPGCQMLVIFDQSSAHNAFSPDALNVKRMNVRPGGKQSKMHATVIPDNNPNEHLRGKVQEMVFPQNHPQYPGEAKGMMQVLQERGLWSRLQDASLPGKAPIGTCSVCSASAAKRDAMEAEARKRMETDPELFGSVEDAMIGPTGENDSENGSDDIYCCMTRCLANQTDFLNEKPLLQIVVEKAGHLCLLLPKFHCELNPIEPYWGYAKHLFRKESDGTFPVAKKLVPKCLDACSVITIRHFFRKVWRYTDAYRKGLTGKMAEFAVQKYKSHRRIAPSVMMEVDMIVT